jgi:hypothetical protein
MSAEVYFAGVRRILASLINTISNLPSGEEYYHCTALDLIELNA